MVSFKINRLCSTSDAGSRSPTKRFRSSLLRSRFASASLPSFAISSSLAITARAVPNQLEVFGGTGVQQIGSVHGTSRTSRGLLWETEIIVQGLHLGVKTGRASPATAREGKVWTCPEFGGRLTSVGDLGVHGRNWHAASSRTKSIAAPGSWAADRRPVEVPPVLAASALGHHRAFPHWRCPPGGRRRQRRRSWTRYAACLRSNSAGER